MRFTRLLVVAWCAAVLCASLGNADATSDVEASPSDGWQGLTVNRELSPDTTSDEGRCRGLNKIAKDFYGNEVTCADGDVIDMSFLYVYVLDDAMPKIKSLLQVQHSPLSFSDADFKGVCSEYELTKPTNDQLAGVDFFIHITLRPMGADGHSLLSKVCTWDETTGRPTSGVLNIAAQYPYTSVSGKRGLTAEILRMLGFNTTVFANKNMVTRATVRGVENVPLVNSPMVLQMARDFYDCPTLPGMELDYDSTNDNAPLPYWRGRVAKDDVMSSAGNMTYVTPMTLAAMEDTGFYKGNYDNAEVMSWGYKAGCDFVTQKCMEGGKSSFGNLFCADGLSSSPAWKCTSDRRAIGNCGMGIEDTDFPSPFQYFADAAEGGSLSTMDYCPVVQAVITTSCVETESSLSQFQLGPNSRCFDTQDTGLNIGKGALNAACFPISCNLATPTYSITLSSTSTSSTPCPAGTTIDLSTVGEGGTLTKGTLTCPPYDEVCVEPYSNAGFDPVPAASSSQPSGSSKQSSATPSPTPQPQPIPSSSSTHSVSSSSSATPSPTPQPQPVPSSSSTHSVSSSNSATPSPTPQPQPTTSSDKTGSSKSSESSASQSSSSSFDSSDSTDKPTAPPAPKDAASVSVSKVLALVLVAAMMLMM